MFALKARLRQEVPVFEIRLAGPLDGTARVQFDQVVPWSAAVELLDILAAQEQDKPQPHS